ncbi:saxiphilin-like isoform X2 [Latimeria chalumnae]|uniref:saxiphilin-like isoform X2 n=1 Tax=Latimeria chalumnae TaxID=7897 RepID=UPI00313E7B5A
MDEPELYIAFWHEVRKNTGQTWTGDAEGRMRVLVIALTLCACILLTWGKKFRWCTLSDKEQRKCAELAKSLLAVLSPAAVNAFGKLSCIKAYSTQDCINKIRGNKADAISLDAGDVYTASKQYDLAIVAKEVYQDGGCVFGVAVVRGEDLSIQTLQGVRSCHSGARRTAGWNIPMGFLLSKNFLPWSEEQSLSEAISEYFNGSCIPGVGTANPQLCALCQGQKSYIRDRNYFCETTDNEPFYDSEGAFRCLKSGKGDVAFLDHTAVANVEGSESDQYRLLCPNGSKAKLSDFRTCNLGQGPGQAVVTRHNYRKVARKFLTVVQHFFGRKGKQLGRFALFNSSTYDGKNLLFRDSTQHLLIPGEDTDINQILGLDYIALLKALGHDGSSLDNSVVRWCVISAAEQTKCEEWALNIKSDPLVCVRASSMGECIERIKRDEVDAVSLDATHAYIAGKCGLVPVAAEYYGYQSFFWKGCMPGAKGNMCKVCVGGEEEEGTKSAKRCTANHNERYYGNMGALRCLVGDPNGRSFGEFAFLEHHTLLDNIESLEATDWASGWTASDFELLCPSGQRAPVTEWEACNLGPVPPNTVMTRPVITTKIYDFLMKSQETLESNLNSEFQLFESQKYGESDLLFKDATACLVHTSHLDNRAILGEMFLQLAESVFNCTHSDVLQFCDQDVCNRI